MTDGVNKIKVVGGSGGPIWFIGWLFTIGFAHLGIVKGLLGLVLWPYFLGVALQKGP
jgi:hypothetical protein